MNRNTRLRWMLAACAVLVIGVLAAPTLITIAQDILDFFTQSSSNSQTVQVYPNGMDSTDEPTDYSSTFTLDQVDGVADFPVLVPSYMPSAYHFDEGRYIFESGSVDLTYRCGNVWGISINQAALSEAVLIAPFDVGADATIEPVDINGAAGQYVRGGWEGAGTYSYPDNASVLPGTSVPLEMVWVNDTNFQMLAWQADGISYLISTSSGTWGNDVGPGPCALTKDDYLAIARSLS